MKITKSGIRALKRKKRQARIERVKAAKEKARIERHRKRFGYT